MTRLARGMDPRNSCESSAPGSRYLAASHGRPPKAEQVEQCSTARVWLNLPSRNKTLLFQLSKMQGAQSLRGLFQVFRSLLERRRVRHIGQPEIPERVLGILRAETPRNTRPLGLSQGRDLQFFR